MESVFPSTSEIAAVLARMPVFAGSPMDDLRVESLAGLTNRTFKVTLGGASYALRLAGAGTARYIDREAEAHNARLAARIGLAPEVLHTDPTSGLLLTRFVEGGTTLSAANFREAQVLDRAARALARLHRSGCAFRGRMRLFAKLDEYMALATGSGPIPRELAEGRALIEPMRRALKRLALPLAPCHIDPTPRNFIGRGEDLLLIDWEYSAMCEPIWDLAGLSIEAKFDAAQDAAMLAAYGGRPEELSPSLLVLYKGALAVLAAAWARVRINHGAGAMDYDSFARQRLARARVWLGRGRMERHLALLPV